MAITQLYFEVVLNFLIDARVMPGPDPSLRPAFCLGGIYMKNMARQLLITELFIGSRNSNVNSQ